MSKAGAAFKLAGFTATKHGVYLKDTEDRGLAEWGAATPDPEGVLVSLGMIAPRVNRFAIGLLKRASEGRVKPQFPAYVGPPIFIVESESIADDRAEEEVPRLIADFENRFHGSSIDEWFQLAKDLSPYGHAQSIILPAYYYLNNDKASLMDYLSKRHNARPVEDVEAYFRALESLAREMDTPSDV